MPDVEELNLHTKVRERVLTRLNNKSEPPLPSCNDKGQETQ